VAITAELIAVRRKVERTLPHMSWFHRLKPAEERAGDAEQAAIEKSQNAD